MIFLVFLTKPLVFLSWFVWVSFMFLLFKFLMYIFKNDFLKVEKIIYIIWLFYVFSYWIDFEMFSIFQTSWFYLKNISYENLINNLRDYCLFLIIFKPVNEFVITSVLPLLKTIWIFLLFKANWDTFLTLNYQLGEIFYFISNIFTRIFFE